MKSKNEILKYSIGIDLGGTKLATALVDSRGNILDYKKIPLELHLSETVKDAKKKVISLMLSACENYKINFPVQTSNKHFMGIGLASAGPLNVATGELISPANFSGWKNFKLVNELQVALKKINWNPKIYFQNDAIAAAYAEKWIGGAQNCKSFVVITVGTGIGSGVIFNGIPCQTSGMGSEWGHCLVDVKGLNSPNSQLSDHTVEGIASGTALIKRAQALGFKGNSVEELVLENQKTNIYHFLFDDMAWALASLCYNLSMGFHLDKILLSGGLIKIKSLYFTNTKNIYKKMIQERNPAFLAPLVIAKSKNNAGVIGAASLPYFIK